jgi:phosphatidylglycerol:prolipoprotein diacylglycerol transferase
MHPILIDFGTHDLPFLGPRHLFLPTYGALFALGAVVALFWFVRRARSLGYPHDRVFNAAFYGLVGGLVGAKLTLILVDWRYYRDNPVDVLWTFRSAGVLMGGVLVGATVFLLYARAQGLPVLTLGDAIVAPLALAQGIGRLGCFAAGCCYGVPSRSGFCAVTFTNPESMIPPNFLGVPLVPTQLLQMANDLLLAVLLSVLWRRRTKPEGTILALYILLYSLTRGLIEFWRGDAERGVWLGGRVSTSQLFCILGLALGSFLLVRFRTHGPARARVA